MRKKIIVLMLVLISARAQASSWKLYDEVGNPPNAATMCHFWNVTLFAPHEEHSCMVGTLFTVDLEAREIRYANATEQGLPRNQADRNLKRSVLANALKGDGFEKLEAMRSVLVAELEEAHRIAASNKARAEYRTAYEAATSSLDQIQAFEAKYAGNDPDGLIPQLAATKEYLTLERYRVAYQNAKTSAELKKFVEDYRTSDPDNLVPEVRKRIAEAEKQEQLAQQKAERERQEKRRQEEQATKKAAANQARNRLQYIQKLHKKYADNVIYESPEAFRIVSGFNIDCRHPDGRVLPLLHALYASMDQTDGMGARMIFYLQNRGQAVRIFSELFRDGKSLGEPSLYYHLNEWGDLQTVGVRSEAVLNACIGSQGPIWLMPGEPGY